jgi:hypothetical protein
VSSLWRSNFVVVAQIEHKRESAREREGERDGERERERESCLEVTVIIVLVEKKETDYVTSNLHSAINIRDQLVHLCETLSRTTRLLPSSA